MAQAVPISVIETPEFSIRDPQAHERRGTVASGGFPRLQPYGWRSHPRNERRAEAAMEIGRPRQARRRAGDLIPSRRGHAAIRADRFRQDERADLSQQDRNAFRRLTGLLVEAFKRRRP